VIGAEERERERERKRAREGERVREDVCQLILANPFFVMVHCFRKMREKHFKQLKSLLSKKNAKFRLFSNVFFNTWTFLSQKERLCSFE
jgi:hypothetical protein